MQNIVKVIDLVPGDTQALPVIAAADLTADQFWSDFVCLQNPVLIREAAAIWPATSLWMKPGYLEANSGEAVVSCSRMFNPLPFGPYWKAALRDRPLAECLAEMRNLEDDETFSIPSARIPEALNRDLGEFSFFGEPFERPPASYDRRRMFLYKNASTEWHSHPEDETLTVQLLGEKRVSMFKISCAEHLIYAEIIEANLHHVSSADQLFPVSHQVTKLEGVLRPGDAVYIPPLWWHGIDPAEASIGATIAHCFASPDSHELRVARGAEF